MYNDALIVRVMYPSSWKTYDDERGKIKITKSEDGGEETFYYGDINETSYDEMFELVEQTIKANQEMTLKLELLRNKVDEMKEIFSEKTYEELQNLKFTFDKPKKNNKKKKITEENKEENTSNE